MSLIARSASPSHHISLNTSYLVNDRPKLTQPAGITEKLCTETADTSCEYRCELVLKEPRVSPNTPKVTQQRVSEGRLENLEGAGLV